MSLDWIPLLHDRGYDFFKLGEEAHVPLDRVTLEGHAGKMTGRFSAAPSATASRFRILAPDESRRVIAELRASPTTGCRRSGWPSGSSRSAASTRPTSAVPAARSSKRPAGRILAFANLLEGPRREELSVDLMRYRSDGPQRHGFPDRRRCSSKASELGYRRFNLGMAPLASVGASAARMRASGWRGCIFQRGEQWYNFQGVRFYKQKFDPEWVPRYMAYQGAWEWPVAIASSAR